MSSVLYSVSHMNTDSDSSSRYSKKNQLSTETGELMDDIQRKNGQQNVHVYCDGRQIEWRFLHWLQFFHNSFKIELSHLMHTDAQAHI